MKNLIPDILDLIKYLPGIPANDVLRQKILEIRDLAETMDKDNRRYRRSVIKLKKEVQRLNDRITELGGSARGDSAESSNIRMMDNYVEHEGALFKRDPDGRHQTVPYCPRCEIATRVSIYGTPFHCNTCGWYASFDDTEIERIISELPAAEKD